MGCCMSRYDDTRLIEDGDAIETRRESFYLRWNKIRVYKPTDYVGTIEIGYKDVPRLRELIDVAVAHGFDDGAKYPPTQDQVNRWRTEESDATLIEDGDKFTDHDLRRLLELRHDSAP